MAKADRFVRKLFDDAQLHNSEAERRPERERRRKSVAIESWIMIYRFWNLLVPKHTLARFPIHARWTRVHKVFFSSVFGQLGTGLCGPHLEFAQSQHTNTANVYHIGGCVRRSKINSVEIDFNLNSKCTHNRRFVSVSVWTNMPLFAFVDWFEKLNQSVEKYNLNGIEWVCVLGCGHGSVCMCRVANERGRKHNRTNKQTIEVCVDWICCSVVVHQSIIRHACYRWTRYFHRLSIYSCMKTVHSNRIGGHAILNKRKAPNVAIRQCKHRRQRRQRENLEKVLRDGSSPQTTSATMGRRRKSWQIN